MPMIQRSSECPDDLVGQLADGFALEWPDWAKTLTRRELEESFRCGKDGALPVVLIAHEDGIALGTISLRQWFAEDPMHESPWVRGFYVVPEARGKGIDRLLASAVAVEAAKRGFNRLYAATTRIERLAVRRGWEVFHRLDHHGEPMAWMRLALA